MSPPDFAWVDWIREAASDVIGFFAEPVDLELEFVEDLVMLFLVDVLMTCHNVQHRHSVL